MMLSFRLWQIAWKAHHASHVGVAFTFLRGVRHHNLAGSPQDLEQIEAGQLFTRESAPAPVLKITAQRRLLGERGCIEFADVHRALVLLPKAVGPFDALGRDLPPDIHLMARLEFTAWLNAAVH